MPLIDPSARGSDISRTWIQYLARLICSVIIKVLRLNHPGLMATELVQLIQPIATIPTSFGRIRCKAGHGRLRWRAATFYTEEPETIAWLSSISKDDILWDVGANVGLYSIFATKSTGCKVLAIEPESQNYSILLENILLNEAFETVQAANFAITRKFGLGELGVHDLTKGGAYNQFGLSCDSDCDQNPAASDSLVRQVQFGISLDDLVYKFNLPKPSYIKIDVDGIEPLIISGAKRILTEPTCKSVLVEVQTNDPLHNEMISQLNSMGYECDSRRSNWESRSNRIRESDHQETNMIFVRK